ncbi:MAG: YdcF family protein [Cytophagaceae bacterium]
MFFILSKILFHLLMPIVLLTLLLILILWLKDKRKKRKALLIAIIAFILLGNDFIVNEALLLWEHPPRLFKEVTDDYDAAIVLSGVTNIYKSPKDRIHMNKGADRVLHAARLYKLGKVRKIIISGGSGSITQKDASESQQLYETFLLCGVPHEDIILEAKSRNTYENALFTTELIKEKDLGKKHILVTSSFHMRRSEACFNKAGLYPDTFPVDYYSHDRMYTPDVLIIPNEGSMQKWRLLIHEIIGYITYKVAGYA